MGWRVVAVALAVDSATMVVWRVVVWASVGIAGLGLATACGAQAFACDSDAQCEQGSCVSGWCAFGDETCPSGLRYGEFAGGGLAGQCVEVDGSTGPEPGTTGSTTTATSATTDPDSGSTLALDETSTGDPPGTSSSDDTSGEAESSSSTGEPIDPSLVAWYRCEGDDPTADASGNGHHGECSSCPGSAPGIDGDACAFDSESAQSFSVPHTPAFELEVFTLAAWVQPVAPIPAGRLYSVVGKAHGSEENNAYQLGMHYLNAAQVAFGCWGSEVEMNCVSTPIEPGRWMHLALTHDGAVGTLWIDKVAVGENELPAEGIQFDDSPLLVGVDDDNDAPDHWMDGLVDEIRLYDRVLDEDEIAAL